MEKDSKGFAGQVNARTVAIPLYAYILTYVSFHAFCGSIQPLPHLPVYWEMTFCIARNVAVNFQVRKGLL